ncbi:LacI family DNA-binding transcriptional regulator [Flammeovirga aprica]|uniref:LacI family transcriptional regulator n=1 Tax=Flammeovirga aprica JL-4 TaxID=694437 RepID=A0A7X9RU64_9BACT|nr:LacI family DNA-binding transcriptional regulator [Flammeovirga aprica]NME68780.1 LacI family transcriptional regulator [Flammeovirga aprica JL-4]
MEIKKATTIHDIAKALNLNSSTISRALNNHPRVSQTTRDKVKAKASELNYQPNNLAANLRTNKSNTIGVVIPFLSRYFFSTAIAGIEDVAQAYGYNVIITQTKDITEKEKESINTLLKSRVEGILISPAMYNDDIEHIEKAINQQIPIFCFDRYAEGFQTTRVIMDDRKTALLMCNHLIQQGAKKITVLSGYKTASIYSNRQKGIIDSYIKHDIDLKHLNIKEMELDTHKAYCYVKDLVEKGNVPDAIYALNDMTAFGAIKALNETKLSVPKDVLVVGFSNEPLSELFTPSLTTVNQPAYEMGKLVAKKLILHLEDNEELLTSETSILKSELIIRESSLRRRKKV